MSRRTQVPPQGQVRHSQAVTTFGPGSLIDLPHHSVIVGGLEGWTGPREEVLEKRLVDKLQQYLQKAGTPVPQLRLFAPPWDGDGPTGSASGIKAWQFPEWFVTQDGVPLVGGGPGMSRMLVHRRALTTRRVFVDDQKKKHPVVPVRFVRACPRGHVSDIDWYRFAHAENTGCRRRLWIDERGTSGDVAEMRVRCECGAGRDLALVKKSDGILGMCNGERPWLGPGPHEGCGLPYRMLIRSASNAYFPQLMSVISLPDKNEAVARAVSSVYAGYLEGLDSIEDLRFVRKKMAEVKAALGGLAEAEVWEEVLARKGGVTAGLTKTVKQAEFEVLSGVRDVVGEDHDRSNFYARSLPESVWGGPDRPWMAAVERVVLVHRLREVVAQIGFTRFEASGPSVEGELQVGAQTAPLAREVTWLPAVENRGEGVFIQFSAVKVAEWLDDKPVSARQDRLEAGFNAWLAAHPNSSREFPGAVYYLLHTVSHLLLTAMSLECGYPASSIRERVYASDSGYGILLYTGSPDAEGTLGGLVETGRQIARHLRAALELARLCSNDPVCAQHDPTGAHEARHLHGAACHGCLLVSETSCEQQNDFLDRALVVTTVDDGGAEFFRD